MKKCLISTLVILGSASISPSYALSLPTQYCPGTSIAVGTKCNSLTGSVSYFPATVDCMDKLTGEMKDTCKTYLCNGTCTCRTTPCESFEIVDTCEKSCFTNISWGAVNLTGQQNGTATIASGTKCQKCPTTLYRCADGYYTTDTTLSLGLPDGTTDNSSIKCTACPQAEDDTAFWIAAPYVASKAGLASLADCYIKANSPISNDSGTYEYTSNCMYTK